MQIRLCSLFLVFVTANSFAQVIKCTDPKTKQITYTDGTCPASTEVKQIQSRQSDEYKLNEEVRASEAKDRIAQGFQREAQATVNHEDTSEVYSVGGSTNSGSFECGIAKQALAVEQSHLKQNRSAIDSKRQDAATVCSGQNSYVQIESARENKRQQGGTRTIAANCNARGCVGPEGTFYTGSGSIVFGPDGRSCTKAGAVLRCE